MSDVGLKVRKYIRQLEADAGAAAKFREFAKFDVKLTPFGSSIVEAAFENDVPQVVVAQLLQVSPSAIARRYADLSD